nr:dehD [Rhizobium sp.]
MIDLPRHPPSMLPVIRTVPEHAATGELKRRYDAVKSAFDVPWMGVVAWLIPISRFFDALWEGLERVAGTRAFQDACRAMRAATEAGVERSLGISPLRTAYKTSVTIRARSGRSERSSRSSRMATIIHLLATVSRYLLEDFRGTQATIIHLLANRQPLSLSGGDFRGTTSFRDIPPASPHIFHQPIFDGAAPSDEHTRGIFADIQAHWLPILILTIERSRGQATSPGVGQVRQSIDRRPCHSLTALSQCQARCCLRYLLSESSLLP